MGGDARHSGEAAVRADDRGPDAATPLPPATRPVDVVLALQRSAGNARTAQMLARRPGPVLGPPTEEQANVAVLEGAARLLGIPNFIHTTVDHTNAAPGMPLGASERHMLFQFWLVVSGRETREGPAAGDSAYREATAAERMARLARGADLAERVIAGLGPGPWPGAPGDAVQAYRAAYAEARERVLDEAVAAELAARPAETAIEPPAFELEQQRRAVESALDALDALGGLGARMTASTASRFNSEIKALLAKIASEAPPGSRLAGVANMPLPEAILHTRGVLNGINAVLQITDADRREELLDVRLDVRNLAERARVLHGVIEGLVAVTCLIGSAVARLLGHAGTAAKLFQLGAQNVVRKIGWSASLAQTIHGISVLLDDKATENQRLQGVLDVAMGSAGLTGAAAGIGVKALAGIAGPASAGILVTAGEVAWLRGKIRAMEKGMATGAINEAFETVEVEAGGVAGAANELEEAMRYAQAPSGSAAEVGDPGEPAAAAQRAVQLRAGDLRRSLERAIERVTDRQPDMPILTQPASWTHVSAPFKALEGNLGAARTPAELLDVARAFVAAARDLFRHFERTIARTLITADDSREGGALPSLLGGLHSDGTEQPDAQQLPVH